jgi:hypothetical protein
MSEVVSLVVGPEAIAGYKRLPYKQWSALAEFIDNSTQAYFDNKSILDPVFKSEGEPLTITIVTDNHSRIIRIGDNSIGMNPAELQHALTIGKPKLLPGRSRYGYGMKTAAGWFGNNWKITTKKLGEDEAAIYELDMEKFISQKPDGQKFSRSKSHKDRHFTTIEIFNLQRSLSERMIRSIREHLSSMYRRDIRDGLMRLVVNEEDLSYPGYADEVWMRRVDGTPYKSDFHFTISGKEVRGWVGVFGEGYGGRGRGGFAILQNNRCVLSEETMWKPFEIFGKEGSTVPQRLIGEIEADGFEVNTQKDDIDWHGSEEEDLAKALKQFCTERNFLKVAGERFDTLRDEGLIAGKDQAIDQIAAFFSRDDVSDALQIIEVPDPAVKPIVVHPLEEMAAAVEDAISVYLPLIQKTFHVKYIRGSVNDPYYTYQILSDLSLLVIINENHPCVNSFAPNNPHFVHLRHCLFDAIAQWQCQLQEKTINPDSVFLIKDRFLRLNPLSD